MELISAFLNSWYVTGMIGVLASWCVKEIIKFLPSWWSWAKEQLSAWLLAKFWLIFYLPKEMEEVKKRKVKILEDLKIADKNADEDEGKIIYAKERSRINSRLEEVVVRWDGLCRERYELLFKEVFNGSRAICEAIIGKAQDSQRYCRDKKGHGYVEPSSPSAGNGGPGSSELVWLHR